MPCHTTFFTISCSNDSLNLVFPMSTLYVLVSTLLCEQLFTSEPLPLFTEPETIALETHKSNLLSSLTGCVQGDTQNILTCAKTAFADCFTPFEAEWTALQAKTEAPSDVSEIKEESSQCLLNCILRGSPEHLQACYERCGRIMSGVAEVSKRKAFLNAAELELKKARDEQFLEEVENRLFDFDTTPAPSVSTIFGNGAYDSASTHTQTTTTQTAEHKVTLNNRPPRRRH
ncbi:hypothetical protein BLNAU_17674 [Blattamonas nauphoetae]|uniref:Uncharacterized protein n=1 Tax=Blattamonas nauphoetae TaxID=2049346 RepID=A0ABQ9X742_9EUKA|nr:hypothetical protein BLNAU_17674 [Blattamonas nauphoetae]